MDPMRIDLDVSVDYQCPRPAAPRGRWHSPLTDAAAPLVRRSSAVRARLLPVASVSKSSLLLWASGVLCLVRAAICRGP